MVPFVYDPNLDQEDDEEQGIASGAPQIAAGSSSNEAPVASGSSPAAKKELDTGSGFQNLDKYLGTNQSQQFGNQVLGKVGDTLNTAKKNQADASQAFQTQVQSANYTPDQEKVTQALNKPEEANAKDFQKWMSQSYEGPKSLAEDQGSWNKYWSGTNQAQTQSKALGSEAGRFSLLDSYFGRPQYNFGEKSLDNLLVQQSGLGKETRGLQNEATQLKSQGQAQAKNLQGFAAGRAGEVEQNKNQVNQAFGLAQTGAQDSVNQALEQTKASRGMEQDAIRANLGQNQVTRDQLARLGLGEGQSIYNMDLNKYLNVDPNLSREQVATDEQRTRLNALAQLAGQEQTFLGDRQDLSNAYGFDSNRFQQDLASTKANYKADYGNAVQVAKEWAPFHGDYLQTMNADTSPVEIMNKLAEEETMWKQEQNNGNPYASGRLDQINKSRNAIAGALSKYNIDSTTGSARNLRVL